MTHHPQPQSTPDADVFAASFNTPPANPGQVRLVPVARRLLSDVLTPVSAYRALVHGDDRHDPSFLFESVIDGDRVGRYSYLGNKPVAQIIARGYEVTLTDHRDADRPTHKNFTSDNPLDEAQRLTEHYELAETAPGLPEFLGGWVGVVGYDTVRYLEAESLASPPADDRALPDLHLQLYRDLVAFDHVQKTIYLITHVTREASGDADAAYALGQQQLDQLEERLLVDDRPPLQTPRAHVALDSPPPKLPPSNMGLGGYQRAVEACKKYIQAGDAFQIVPSQRFELQTAADPFDIYRALRVVNPSPYMFYLQIDGGMLVGSSPEILVNVTDRLATSRPLAGTRKRGATPAQDQQLEEQLLADPKDRAEHIMLVDLHRNDIGRIAAPGTVQLKELLAVERYSHVMHISSTITGKLRDGLTAWDALRVSLPVGTVSGAPKVRAMQIIDELEPTRRGPYGGAVGFADFAGNMDMCIALRTMVITPQNRAIATPPPPTPCADAPKNTPKSLSNNFQGWNVHIQAGAGIVADSDPDAEHEETVNKAAALAKAVEVAERLFT